MSPQLKTGTHVVVADSEKLLIFENAGDTEIPVFRVERKQEQDNPPTHEQGANRPGRYHDGPSPHRSAVGETDWHRLGKERFADEIADLLYRRVHAGTMERIVLVAAPLILGELRQKLHKEVAERIVAEIDKTLTNHPVHEIETILNRDLD